MNQVRGFRAHYDKFQAVDSEIIEISCDSVAVQKAWVESMGEHEGVEGVPLFNLHNAKPFASTRQQLCSININLSFINQSMKLI